MKSNLRNAAILAAFSGAGKMPALVRLRAHLVGGVKVLSKST